MATAASPVTAWDANGNPISKPASRPTTAWDQNGNPVSSYTPSLDQKQAEDATDSLIYSNLTEASPSFVNDNHDEFHKSFQERLGEWADAGWKGLTKDSIVGEWWHHQISGPVEGGDEVSRWIEQFGQMAGDLPFYLTGAGLGALAGGAAGTLEVPGIGTISGAAVGAGAGGFGLTAAMRKWLVEKYQDGSASNFHQIWKTIEEGGKGAITGAAFGVAGEVAPLAEGVVGKVFGARAYKAAAELATMTTVGSLVEGHVPTAQDFIDNAAMFAAMSIGMRGMDVAKGSLKGIQDKMMDLYAREGVHPSDTTNEGGRKLLESTREATPAEIMTTIDRELSGNRAPEEEMTAERPAEPQQEPGLRPAVLGEDESVRTGDAGQTHEDVVPEAPESDRRFIDPEGEVLTRKEAEEWVKQNEPDVYREWRAESGGKELHSEDYNAAKERVTSIKNAVTQAERESRGMSAVEVEARRTFGQVFDNAKNAVDSGRIKPRELAEDIAQRPRTLAPEESAALLYDRMRLQNEHQAIMSEIESARQQGDTEKVDNLRDSLKKNEDQMDANDHASRRAGYEQGLALAARKMMLKEDYSLSNVLQRARAASKDGTVSPELRARLEDLTNQLDEANKRIDEYEEQKKQKAAEQAVERIKARESRRTKRVESKAELKTEFDSLIRDLNGELMQLSANPMLNPKLYYLFGKLAENRIRSGLVSIEQIVDDIHAELQDKLSKRQIRDYISRYGVKQEMSKDEIQRQLREARRQGKLISQIEDVQAGEQPQKSGLQREKESARVKELSRQLDKAMRDAGMKVSPEVSPESRLQAYKTRMENRIAELENQLKTGDFTKKPRRTTVLDREAEDLRAKAEKVKQQVDDAIRKQELANAGNIEKGARLFQKWRRAVLLSSITTLGKLQAAAMYRFGLTPIEELLGGVLGKLPGVSEIAAKAPREGGLNISAEAKALSQFFDKSTAQDIRETVKTGKTSLDYLYGRKNTLPPEALDFFGHLHGAIKVLPKRAEFFRSVEKRAQWALDNHLDIEDPRVQATIAADAYIDANRAIFMQENFINTGFKIMMNYFHSQGLSGRSLEFMTKVVLPIVKVPTNIVGETLDYATGAPKAALQVLTTVVKKDALRNLTMQQADNIMRSLKKGSLGLALLAIGYYAGGNTSGFQAGGFYQPGDEKKRLKAEDLVIGGVKIPHFLQDSPAFLTLQMGATLRKVNESYRIKGQSGGMLAGAMAGGLGALQKVPFLEEAGRMGEAFRNEKTAGLFIDDLIQSLIIPPDVRRIAQMTDTSKKSRKPSNLKETLEKQIPGLRENVPTSRGKKRKFSLRGAY